MKTQSASLPKFRNIEGDFTPLFVNMFMNKHNSFTSGRRRVNQKHNKKRICGEIQHTSTTSIKQIDLKHDMELTDALLPRCLLENWV